MLGYGTPVEFTKLAKKEIYVPLKDKDGGLLGFLRVIFTAVEILISFFPAIGAGASAAISIGFAAIQAGLTVESYLEGNIRSTGQLFGALAVDLLPSLTFGAGSIARALRTEAIVVETIEDGIQTGIVNRIFTRGTKEYKEQLEVLKSQKVRKLQRVGKYPNEVELVSRVSKKQIANYRAAYLKHQASLGRDTKDIVFDDFEFKMNELLGDKYGELNQDRSFLRRLKNVKNYLSLKPEKYHELIEETSHLLSPEARAIIKGQGWDVRNAIDELVEFTESRKLTSVINRIFASGESDWASKEFWNQVKNGKILKSGNFYTQAAQALSANDVGREIITKPFNALIRKNKEFLKEYKKQWIDRWTNKYLMNEIEAQSSGPIARAAGKKAQSLAESMSLTRAADKEISELSLEFSSKTRAQGSYIKQKLARSIIKGTKYEEKIRREIGKQGRYWGGSLVMGYRVLQELEGMKVIQVYFNKVATNAHTFGSKNRGGKKDIIMPITNHMLKKWKKAASHSEFYLSHIALSRGGRPIGYEVQDGFFSNFLSFVPLPALRNILSVISNFKSVIKDISKGTFFSSWFSEFSKTVKRLYIHKLGKLGGSFLSILGEGIGKEGQRIGLGIAKGFQHSNGQSLGKFNIRGILKETLPQGVRGTVLRAGQGRLKQGKMRTASQTNLSAQRYETNIRRIVGIPKIK